MAPTLTDLDDHPISLDAGESGGSTDPAELDQAPPRRTAPPPTPAPAGPGPRRPGRPPRADRPRADRARVTAPPAPSLDDDARAAGVRGLVQIPAGVLLLAGKVTKKDVYIADGVAVASVADDTAAACVQIAKTDPKFAAALDKICAVGPYGALITVAFSLGTQIARNHNPARKLPGTIHPDELLKAQRDMEEKADAA